MTASPDRSKHLTATVHIDLVFAVRDALDGQTAADTILLLREFSIGEPGDHESVGRMLQEAEDADLMALAGHLRLPLPNDAAKSIAMTARNIDAYTELVAAETALRQVIGLLLGDKWRDDYTQERVGAIEKKRAEEDKRRDGVTVSQDLLDYTETHQLQEIINKHWVAVKPVLDDKTRTDAYLGIMLDVRNAIAHSRPVVPSERLLLAGAAGQIQNQLSRYRSTSTGPDAHYASINYVRDSMGSLPMTYELYGRPSEVPRVSVGQIVTFEGSATDPKGRDITWHLKAHGHSVLQYRELGTLVGDKITYAWVVVEADVGEDRRVTLSIRNASKYQRNNEVDGSVTLAYHVNPPS